MSLIINDFEILTEEPETQAQPEPEPSPVPAIAHPAQDVHDTLNRQAERQARLRAH